MQLVENTATSQQWVEEGWRCQHRVEVPTQAGGKREANAVVSARWGGGMLGLEDKGRPTLWLVQHGLHHKAGAARIS